MTYVVGVKRLGVSAIITDSFLVTGGAELSPASIKSGVLFPGCIFGISGNWRRAWDCIQDLRKRCTQPTLTQRFETLGQRIYFYPFAPGADEQFEILLSLRGRPPSFFVIDSCAERVRPVIGDVCTFGSGKNQLDEIVYPYADTMGSEERLAQWIKNARDQAREIADRDFAYFYAFLLFQRTFGDAGARLARDGVGGFVHFITQERGVGERRQDPCVYLLSQFNEQGEMHGWISQRVAFDHDDDFGDVLVSCQFGSGMDKPQWGEMFQNDSERAITITDLNARALAITARHKESPMYRILLAGGIDWKARGKRIETYNIFADVWRGKPALHLEGTGSIDGPLYDFLKANT